MNGPTNHVVFASDPSGVRPLIRCNNCGWEYVVALPVSITMLRAISDAANLDHSDCQPIPIPAPQEEP